MFVLYMYSVLVVALIWCLFAVVNQWFDIRHDPYIAGMIITGLSLIWPVVAAFFLFGIMATI